jgi:hypothetical protein
MSLIIIIKRNEMKNSNESKTNETKQHDCCKWIEEVYKPWYKIITQPKTEGDTGENPPPPPPPPPGNP